VAGNINLREKSLPLCTVSLFKKTYKIIALDFMRAGEVSLKVQKTLKQIGFDKDLIRRASVCAYEAEMNTVMYGGGGDFTLSVEPDKISFHISDRGPGIENIEQALVEGYSTATPEFQEMGFGAGMGLPNIKKNSDHLDIDSKLGEGTQLTIVFEV
jgi:anti-sigma regulatory factor (Ser/Thr protein kinase)